MTDTEKLSPIEVWLSQQNMTVTCTIVEENETTTSPDIDSLSMRGAQREITGYLIRMGYEPAGRWETEAADDDGTAHETVRKFK